MTPKSGSKISFAVDVAAVVGDCVGGSGDGGGGSKANNSNWSIMPKMWHSAHCICPGWPTPPELHRVLCGKK